MTSPDFMQSRALTPAGRRFSVEGLLGLVFLAIALLGGTVLWWLYQESLEAGRSRAETLARILNEHLGRTIASLDTAMVQLALHSQRIGGPDAPDSAWAPALAATGRSLTGIGSISVLNSNGIITHSTLPAVVGQSRADRFLATRMQEAGDVLVADTPIFGAVSRRYFLPFGRRLVDANGAPAGFLAVTLDPEKLRAFYHSLDVGASGLIWVLHPEGNVLFREPSSTDPLGQIAGESPILRAYRLDPTAGFVPAPLVSGGPDYLTAYRHLTAPSLIVAVSLATRDVLAEWRKAAWLTAGVLAAVGSLLGFAAWRLRREIRARGVTESQLAVKVTQLEATIDERDDAHSALSESQARFQAIMDHAPVTVFVKDLDGRITFVSNASRAWSGVTPSELIGKTVDDMLPPEEAAFHRQFVQEVIAKRAPIQREVQVTWPQGKRTGLYNRFPILDAAGNVTGVGAVVVDVTAQRQLEAQLLQSQKMESIGQLTGGIAHDFNNLLTAILLNADILASRLQPEDRLQPLAQVILEAAERGADLTKRLLAFSRRQMLETRPVDINELVAGMEALMRRTLGEHIAIVLALGDELRAANVDPSQLETAILNLALNARDAMPSGGRLTIETAVVPLDDTYAANHAEVTAGEYVMLAVSDTGNGMPADVAARAFEPFFTTKDVGKGTGLGLSMVYGFVKQTGGHVKIYSEQNVGTCVKVYLPCADAPAETPAAQPAAEALPRGVETVLLVEDDRLVRNNAEAQLRALGYSVVTAEAADEALAKIDAGLVPDLLFTDVVMPGRVNGFELASRIRARLPGLRVLFTSGYTHGATPQADDASAAARHFLGKPFRRRDLAVKLREALDDVDH